MQLACDLVEVSLKRLHSRRMPATKKYKHNLNEERQLLQDSANSVYACVKKLQAPLFKEFQEIQYDLLRRVTSKESLEDEETKASLVQFLWQVSLPLYCIESSI